MSMLQATRPSRLRMPLNVIANHQAAVDVAMASLIVKGRAIGIHLICKPGCAACCAYVAQVVMIEAEDVAEAVEALPLSSRQEVIDRLYAWSELWRIFTPDDQCPMDQPTLIRWQTRRTACPMLDPETYRCMVYDRRPTACRTHHATNVKPGAELQPCGVHPHVGDPSGCVTTQENVRCGHQPGVMQLNPDAQTYATADLMERLIGRDALVRAARRGGRFRDNEADLIEPVVLPVGVLLAGRRRFGWLQRSRVALETVGEPKA